MKLLARSALKAPFVKTVAAASLVGGVVTASACSGESTGTETPTTNPADSGTPDSGGLDSGSPDCPSAKPADDAPCNLPATESCGYDDCYGEPATTASCKDGKWEVATHTCNPPAPACPDTKPTEDAPCNLPATESCGYDDCYGEPATTASCKDGKWEVATHTCNPPAPECPDTTPTEGSSCPAQLASITCPYYDCRPPADGGADAGTGPATYATCTDGKWKVIAPICDGTLP